MHDNIAANHCPFPIVARLCSSLLIMIHVTSLNCSLVFFFFPPSFGKPYPIVSTYHRKPIVISKSEFSCAVELNVKISGLLTFYGSLW